MDADEILDGLALWNEHKPQTAGDWAKVAERLIEAGERTDGSSPLFAALVQAVRERQAAEQQRDRLLEAGKTFLDAAVYFRDAETEAEKREAGRAMYVALDAWAGLAAAIEKERNRA